MARVLIFSRFYPSLHPYHGEPTHFVEKLTESFLALGTVEVTDEQLRLCDSNIMRPDVWEKWHTVRLGHRWKPGDWFSPRYWSDRPYNSKQITIAPDIQVKKVWNLKMIPSLWFDECEYLLGGEKINSDTLIQIAKNDGLKLVAFILWITGKDAMSSKRKPFDGQIICWNENINYNTLDPVKRKAKEYVTET